MKLFAVVLVGLSLIFFGCGKKAVEKMAEAAAEREGVKAKFNIDDQGLTIETKEGISTYAGGKNAKVPDNFPKDVCVYEGATLLSSVSVPNGFHLNLRSKDAADKVAGSIKSKMVAEGWKEEATLTQAEQIIFTYKKDKRSANFVVTGGDEDETQIILTVVSEKDQENGVED